MPRKNKIVTTDRATPKPRRRRTVRGKLQQLVLICVGLAVGLVAGVSAWRDSTRDSALQANRFEATAKAIGSVASDAVAAHDRSRAFRALRSVGQMPGVMYARLETADGQMLVETGAGARLVGDAQVGGGARSGLLSNLTSRTVEISAPVINERSPVGRIVLLSRSEGVLGVFLSSLLTSAIAACAAVGVGLLAAARLQRNVTRPIVALTRSMHEVERDHDYGRTVDIVSDDEVGELVDGFNRMLAEVRASAASPR